MRIVTLLDGDMPGYFCIRDDDTNFFTSPEQLDAAYGKITQWGPVSLAVVPFHRAGTSKAVPEKFRRRWTVHPLHENSELVDYLRDLSGQGRFEIMLHGYHHDEPSGAFEFAGGDQLAQKLSVGRKYLEDLFGVQVRVFVAPRNVIKRKGLVALANEGLHLAGVAGVRSGWPLFSRKTWSLWISLRKWRTSGGLGVPWVLDLGDHREIAGAPVTPVDSFQKSRSRFDQMLKTGGVFCAATHYWELSAASQYKGEPTVGEHLRYLVDRARSNSGVVWQSVGDILTNTSAVI